MRGLNEWQPPREQVRRGLRLNFVLQPRTIIVNDLRSRHVNSNEGVNMNNAVLTHNGPILIRSLRRMKVRILLQEGVARDHGQRVSRVLVVQRIRLLSIIRQL